MSGSGGPINTTRELTAEMMRFLSKDDMPNIDKFTNIVVLMADHAQQTSTLLKHKNLREIVVEKLEEYMAIYSEMDMIVGASVGEIMVLADHAISWQPWVAISWDTNQPINSS